MLFIYFALYTIKIREITWYGVPTVKGCYTGVIAKAEKFNHLNPIDAILNMANICVCISIKLGGWWNLSMTWPGITISCNTFITSLNHNTLLILLHTITTQYHFTQPIAHGREDKCERISAQLSKYNFYFLQEMMPWLYWCWILVKLTNNSVPIYSYAVKNYIKVL